MNSVCERVLGSVRRECLDHLIILSETHLQRILADYALSCFNKHRAAPPGGRPADSGLGKTSPPSVGSITALPVLGGLHHDYRRRLTAADDERSLLGRTG